MADVYLEHSDLEISKEDVFQSSDINELKSWFDEQNEVAGEILAMIGALKLAPDACTTGLARKLGYINISITWITKRLRQLGVDKEDLVADRDIGIRKQFRVLEGVVQQHKAKIKELNIENSDLRQRLMAFEKREQPA